MLAGRAVRAFGCLGHLDTNGIVPPQPVVYEICPRMYLAQMSLWRTAQTQRHHFGTIASFIQLCQDFQEWAAELQRQDRSDAVSAWTKTSRLAASQTNNKQRNRLKQGKCKRHN